MTATPTLTLGPVLFNWDADSWSDFYARIADEAPVDTVAIGEVVCAKRLPFYADRLPTAVERLERAGKEVVLSSLALVTLPRERRQTADLATDDGPEVEVNDLTALAHLDGRPFTVGPFVNVYNEATLAYLAGRGARRVCLPPELPLTSIATLAGAAGGRGVAIEVWAFGRLPLALSGRCYHARLHGLTKNNCRFVCAEDRDGREVDTLDGEPFLAINGIQTLSHAHASLLGDLPALLGAGVTSFRLSPQSCDMVEATRLFRRTLDREVAPGEAQAELARLLPAASFANGFLEGPNGAAFVTA